MFWTSGKLEQSSNYMHSLSLPAVLLPAVCLLARQAGEAILEVYRSSFSVTTKTDGSPVTKADRIAERLIIAGLRRLACNIPIVAEEAITAGEIPDISVGSFWLVDPLDGTEAFIQHNKEFTVNIALIQKGQSVLGVIYAPIYKHLYSAITHGFATIESDNYVRTLQTRSISKKKISVVSSCTHDDPVLIAEFLRAHKVRSAVRVSSSLKLCLVAAGQADFYPRFGRTMEWDTAAGHAILRAAGGGIYTTSGEELHYGKPGFRNPNFIARGTIPYR